jgi:hypothetical protein
MSMSSTFQKLFKVKILKSHEQQRYAKFNGKIYEVVEYSSDSKRVILQNSSGVKLHPTTEDKWCFVTFYLENDKIGVRASIDVLSQKFLVLIFNGVLHHHSYVNLLMYNKENKPTLFFSKEGFVVVKPAKLRYMPETEIKDLLLQVGELIAQNTFRYGVGDVSKNPEFIAFLSKESDKIINTHFEKEN